MQLFDNSFDAAQNLLPKDGVVHYYGKLLQQAEADHYQDCLLHTIAWNNDTMLMYGKLLTTKRKVAWYGNAGLSYTYSNSTKTALPWTKELLELKKTTQARTGETFNSCLLNLYHNGEE